MKRIMVTGSSGQIGTELLKVLREKYGSENVLAADIQQPSRPRPADEGPFEFCDITERKTIETVVRKYGIDTIYHMAAILSAKGERNPGLAWNVNVNGTYNILETARESGAARVFIPSSIAAFGPETPRENTPQETILRPKTIYGISKVTGELLGEYYVRRFKLDVRGCRFPGIISHETLPGGGTTDYAVAIFYEAVKNKKYTCFLREDTRLPMMYMPDCLKSIIRLMEADIGRLKHYTDFNIGAMSFSPGELASEIRKHIPEFFCDYQPDYRQALADSWPKSIDDSAAREEWDWKPDYDLSTMTKDMIETLMRRQADGRLNY
jgi:threonine 3-dehydrogenase